MNKESEGEDEVQERGTSCTSRLAGQGWDLNTLVSVQVQNLVRH